MPTYAEHSYDQSKRRKAWIAHLIAKGCHPHTARNRADKRIRTGNRWPPA